MDFADFFERCTHPEQKSIARFPIATTASEKQRFSNLRPAFMGGSLILGILSDQQCSSTESYGRRSRGK